MVTLVKGLDKISSGSFIPFDGSFLGYDLSQMGQAVAQWLRHCPTNRKVAGSIPDGVIGIFH
jgi:hypothetical protein